MTPTSKNKTATEKTIKKKVSKKKVLNNKKASTKNATKKSTKPSKQNISSIDITPEERWKMIAVAAYHKAEKRGFAPSHELQDWTEAEKEIDKLMLG